MSPPPAGVVAAPSEKDAKRRLILQLIRPYRGWLAIVLAAMLVEVLMSLAAPWPLKLVLDDALGTHHLPAWLEWAHQLGIGRHTLGVALFAGLATVADRGHRRHRDLHRQLLHQSVGQWVANDLRLRIYEHLHRLSLGFYDTAKTGTLMSTITSDVATVQNFASSSTLGILVDIVTIVFMLGLMFWLDWDFTLIAVAVTPFLLLFVMRFKKAVKKVTREVRKRQSEIVAVVQQGLGSVRAVKAFGRQDLEAARMTAASRASVEAALKARRVKSLLSPVVAVVVAAVHRHRALARHGADHRRRDDRRRADRLPRLPEQVLQAGAGPREDDQHDRADRGRRSSASRRSSTPTTSSRNGPTPAIPAARAARSRSSTWPSATTQRRPCCAT